MICVPCSVTKLMISVTHSPAVLSQTFVSKNLEEDEPGKQRGQVDRRKL